MLKVGQANSIDHSSHRAARVLRGSRVVGRSDFANDFENAIHQKPSVFSSLSSKGHAQYVTRTDLWPHLCRIRESSEECRSIHALGRENLHAVFLLSGML